MAENYTLHTLNWHNSKASYQSDLWVHIQCKHYRTRRIPDTQRLTLMIPSIRTNQLSVRTNQFSVRTNQFSVRTNQFSVRTNQLSVRTNQFSVRINQLSVRTNQLSVRTNQLFKIVLETFIAANKTTFVVI